MKVTSNKINNILIIAFLIALLLNTSFALNFGINDLAEEPKEIPDDGDNPDQGTRLLPDLILMNFTLEKNQIFSNETIAGNFEVEIVNNSHISFDAVLTIKDLDYKEEFDLNESRVYNIKPILFSKSGTYKIDLVLDKENKIEEINEDNNRLTFEIIVNEIPEEPRNETDKKEKNYTDLITGLGFFDVRDNARPNTRTYVYVNGKLIQTIDNDDTNFYYHQDLQQNIVLVSDDYSNIVQETYYEPFGNKYHLLNAVFNNKLFSEEELDKSGLIYFKARHYDSGTGRFISTDPLVNVKESSYNYVGNNPLGFSDPDGKRRKSNNEPELIVKGPGGAYYNIDQVNVYKRIDAYGKTKNEIVLNRNSAAGTYVGATGAVSVLAGLYSNYKEVQEANEIYPEHNAFVFNDFWKKYLSTNQVAELRDIRRKGWTDKFTGIIHKDLYDPPYKYSVYESDIKYTLKNINTEQEINSFINANDVALDENTGNLYFYEINQNPVNEEIKYLYFETISRIEKNKNLQNNVLK